MLTSAQAMPVGNAVRLELSPADGIVYSKVLRKASLPFTGANDAGATVIAAATFETELLDLAPNNGTLYYYKDYGWNGSAFVDDGEDPVSVTPAATYIPGGPDVRDVIKQRIEIGLKQEIARGLLVIRPHAGAASATVEVLTAPPVFDESKWPVVSVHLQADASTDRSVADELTGNEDEGWLSTYTVNVTAWSMNPQERHLLHKAVKRLLQANAAVFAMLGINELDVRAEDVDYVSGEYAAPVYCSSFTLTCKAAAYVSPAPEGVVIESVTVENTVSVPA